MSSRQLRRAHYDPKDKDAPVRRQIRVRARASSVVQIRRVRRGVLGHERLDRALLVARHLEHVREASARKTNSDLGVHSSSRSDLRV